MAAPTYIAVNQTASPIELIELRLVVPASGQVNLSTFNPTYLIQSDAELLAAITNDQVRLNDGSATLSKADSLQYLSPVASKQSLLEVEAAADITTWATVEASLGGEAGAVSGMVFKSDGLGGGSMSPNTQVIPRYLTVGLSGDVDHTSIADAVQVAITGGVDTAHPWVIRIYPGTYTEDPMTIPEGLTLAAVISDRIDTVYVLASTATDDLFTLTGGTLVGLHLSGVTDPAKCLVRCATPNTLSGLFRTGINRCSNGMIASSGAQVILLEFSVTINSVAQTVGTAITVTGTGTYLGIQSLFAACPAVLLPYYATNPIQTLAKITDSATCSVAVGTLRIAPKDSTADVFLCDGGTYVNLMSMEFSGCGNAIHIGSSGSDTTITTQGVTMTSNTLNVFNESSTGVVFCDLTVDETRRSTVTGSKLIGLVQYRVEEVLRLIGDVKYQYLTGKDVPVSDFFFDWGGYGVCEGGEVTAATGLHVDVAAGEGWITRGSPNSDTYSVTWDAAEDVDLTASTTNYVYYDSYDETVKSGTSSPGETGILLATVVTDVSGIRFLHQTRYLAKQLGNALQVWVNKTQKQFADTGIVIAQGSGVRKLDVSSGSYYLGLDIIPYAGTGGDGTWSTFYGTNGVTEVASQTSLDITYYDNAGTLTAMTTDYYRADYLILTSDGRLSLIYGTGQFVDAVSAEVSTLPTVPTFIQPSHIPLARIIVKQGVGIEEIQDLKPTRLGGGAGGAGVSSHSALTDLDHPADHTWAMLVDGTRSMTGDLNMGGHAVTNVGNVDGVDISSHASRHLPGGTDALTMGTPVAISVGASPAEGDSANFSRGNHQHGITAGTPGAVGTANAAGTASSVARSDHVHAGLTRGANDFSVFTEKTVPVAGDLFLMEDSAASGAKKFVGYSSIIAGAHGDFANGGDTAGAARSLGNNDSYGLTFLTNGTTRLTITASGDVTAAGRLASNTYIMGAGPDLSCTPVVGGQSVITTWWGLQLVGNKQSTVEYTPSNIGTSGAYGVLVPCQQAAAVGFMIRGTSGQSGDLTQWQNSAGAVLAQITAAGNFVITGTVNGVSVAAHAARHQPGGSDAIPTDTAVTVGTTNGTGSSTSLARADHVHAHGSQSDGTLHAAAIAGSTSGFMTGADKTKLDGIASGATNTPLTSTAPANVTKATAAVGVATDVARSDHKHDVTTAAAATLSVGGSNAEGTATSLARSDHTHALPAFGSIAGTFAQGNDSRLSDDRTASGLRSATTVVNVSASAAPSAGQVLIASGGTAAAWTSVLTSNLPVNVTKATASAGTNADVSRSDHKHDVTTAAAAAQVPGDTAAEGTATSLARSDHKHGLPSYGTGTGTICQGNDSRLSDNLRTNGVAGGQTCYGGTAASENLILNSTSNATKGYVGCNDNFFVNCNGSDQTEYGPRTIGFNNMSTGESARYQFGDTANAWQNGYDMSMQMYAYHPIILMGRRNTAAIPAFDSRDDIGVLVQNTGTAIPAFAIRGANGQTANLQEWRNYSETVLTTVKPTGEITAPLVTLDDTTTEPAVPTTGSRLFARFRAGRRMASQIGPSGMSYGFQPALFANKIGWWTALGNGTTVTAVNFGTSNTGTATTRSVATTSFFTTIRRMGLVSGTTAGSSAGVRHNLAQFFRGNGAGIGGFFFVARFGIAQTQTNYRWFVGLRGTTGVFGNADPSGLTNLVGIGQDGADANIQFIHNDNTASCTKVDLGASWPRPTANTQFYEFRLFIASNGSTYYWSLENLVPANNLVVEGDTGVSTNIPSNTTLLSPQVWINNNAQAAAVGIDVSSLYIETDN